MYSYSKISYYRHSYNLAVTKKKKSLKLVSFFYNLNLYCLMQINKKKICRDCFSLQIPLVSTVMHQVTSFHNHQITHSLKISFVMFYNYSILAPGENDFLVSKHVCRYLT